MKKKTQAAGKTGAWRIVNRVQLAEVLGVHPDSVTDFSRQGMPVLERGGHGKESRYDLVKCNRWQLKRMGKNAKEAAQTELYQKNARLAELKIAVQEGDLLPREEVVAAGQAFSKGLMAAIRSIPRRARNQGVITKAVQESGLVELVRHVLTEISGWKTVADIKRSTKAADAA